jgi:hypothetical protein
MIVSRRLSRSLGRISLLFAFVVTLATAMWSGSAHAQSFDEALTSITPYALFQSSTLTGSGNVITAIRVPVVTSAGKVVYKDVTVQFDVDSAGDLTLTGGFPEVVASKTPLTSHFIAGNYGGPGSLANFLITVSGPGVAPGGATEWSLGTASGANSCTYPAMASWYVGSLSSSPIYSRLKAASITSTAWSYGVGGLPDNTACGDSYTYTWNHGSLLGLSQTGNAITVASFTNGYGNSDHNYPVDQITYTLQQ